MGDDVAEPVRGGLPAVRMELRYRGKHRPRLLEAATGHLIADAQVTHVLEHEHEVVVGRIELGQVTSRRGE